ncbi:hypothetical protein pb186bvf_010884 [Paramecium bursaria]
MTFYQRNYFRTTEMNEIIFHYITIINLKPISQNKTLISVSVQNLWSNINLIIHKLKFDESISIKLIKIIKLMQNIIGILKQVKDFDMLGLDIELSNLPWRSIDMFSDFMLISFVQMIRDIQEGANPVTQKTSQLLQQNEGFSFPAQTFIVVAFVGDQNNQPIVNTKQKTYYTLVFQKLFYDTQQSTNYFFEKCNNKTFNFIQSARANLPRDALYCLSQDVFEKDKIMRIENSFSLKNITSFQISIYRCVNSTTDYVCASKEEIDAKLNNSQKLQLPFPIMNSIH